ncbi:E3 ubiquitin-protein ligase RNF168 [Spea bombifrons]|uniref:E3 ubiquitin-protein ligase RNF168 n=1 Tax=Spea bombifrons TaxID=233779 RepID=UPI00234A40E0|nr:E3 ubiquitin-protein ligase RNF168 [Spea bombifrons]
MWVANGISAFAFRGTMPKAQKSPLTWSECVCPICREILLEPVTLPCDHTLCSPCFQSTVEKASLCCPFCRKRVSTWARYHARSGTLVNKKLWNKIQSQYPEECQRRACGQETEDLEDESVTYPDRTLCKPGEIRQEYEAEISKAEAERIAREEAERKASEEYIQKLLAEEEEEQRRLAEAIHKEKEEQLKRDEELARSLSYDLNESNISNSSSVIISPMGSPTVHKHINTSKSCKRSKGKGSQSRNIERFLSPKHQGVMNTSIYDEVNLNVQDISANGFLVDDEDENSMPTLSPQETWSTHHNSSNDTGFNHHILDAVDCDSLQNGDATTSKVQNGLHHFPDGLNGAGIGAGKEESVSSCLENCETHSSCVWDSLIASTPEQHLKVTPKRKCEGYSNDSEPKVSGKRKRMHLGDPDAGPSLHATQLTDREDHLYDRRTQEEQDRLLALQLQKELDKEQSQVVRKKGSPDEYLLRPKRRNDHQECEEPTALKQAGPKTPGAQGRAGRAQGVSNSDENKKPPPRSKVTSPLSRRARATSAAEASSSEGINILRPSNKQQTILELFQRSVGK